ncbi:Circadian clock protein kinase KaiC [wastewater metagenome]|uniref:non-specific serine/threonine protein kinase n=4 Tax=root TaxID=1 RepID=A0A5B8RAC5_9ZZZZ|nr:circadian clock protein kinase KaiC [uncultured organism]
MRGDGDRLSTGIGGLDTILDGGLLPRSAYLVRGGPGLGKTTLGLNFLAAAGDEGNALFIGFQEAEDQLRTNAASVGIDVDGIRFLSLAPDEEFFTGQQGYDVFASADVEQQPLAELVVSAVEAETPTRVFVDSLTQLRFLSSDVFQYRKQVLSFLRFLRDRGATVLFSSESSRDLPDDDLQFMADGVIALGRDDIGASLSVTKFRGSGFREGPHQMRVSARGLEVFPRPSPPESKLTEQQRGIWSTGIAAFDDMLSGGLEAGTVSLVTGPSGIGKSTFASLFVAQALRRGTRAGIYLFEEEMASYLTRTEGFGIELREPAREGRLTIEQIEPMRYLADEFALRVREHVDKEGVELVVLDSIAGFELALDGEGIKARLHALAKSLARVGVTVLLINEIEAMSGQSSISERSISYLADNVICLRYVELDGEMCKSISVLKKRLSDFDHTLYAFELNEGSIRRGEPLRGLGDGLMTAQARQRNP